MPVSGLVFNPSRTKSPNRPFHFWASPWSGMPFALYIALRKVVPEKRNVVEEEPEAAEEAQVA